MHFGREIIEVSTFRAQASQSTKIDGNKLARKVRHLDSAHNQSGMILRDNVYGSMEEDAVRRDFTVNALYYTVQGFTIHDFCHGLEDIQNRTLRIIGDPEQRYREDPVRILRAIRLACKLNFTIDKPSQKQIETLAYLLESIPPARLFDEFMKMFFHGKGLITFRQLVLYRVFSVLFPPLSNYLSAPEQMDIDMLESAFLSTDDRINNNKSVTPAFLLAAILWPVIKRTYQNNIKRNMPPMLAMHEAGQEVIAEQITTIAIPKRFTIPMREIWEYQLRLQRRTGKRATLLISRKRFRAAFDFLLLREASGEDLSGLGQWWEQFQEASSEQRQVMQHKLQQSSPSKRRKRGVKSKQSKHKSTH